MGLTLAERKAVTKTIAARYSRADKAAKGRILDEGIVKLFENDCGAVDVSLFGGQI